MDILTNRVLKWPFNLKIRATCMWEHPLGRIRAYEKSLSDNPFMSKQEQLPSAIELEWTSGQPLGPGPAQGRWAASNLVSRRASATEALARLLTRLTLSLVTIVSMHPQMVDLSWARGNQFLCLCWGPAPSLFQFGKNHVSADPSGSKGHADLLSIPN